MKLNEDEIRLVEYALIRACENDKRVMFGMSDEFGGRAWLNSMVDDMTELLRKIIRR